MLFSEILGQEHIKNHLKKTADSGRIPHAQLFVGPQGCGVLSMAIAYAQYVICKGDKNETCNLKFNNFSHPDLHFIFPNVSTEDVKSKPKSSDFIVEWREFLAENPYGGLFDWYKFLGAEKKQGEIRVDDAQDVLKTLALKSYEGGYKVLIIWMAEKMNITASNKLLKLIEEPTDKTLLILVAENEEAIIQTIRSRCQVLRLSPLPERIIAENLIEKENCDEKLASKIAHQSQGNWNKAMHLLHQDSDDLTFEEWFVTWVRTAYSAKGNAAAINDLIIWSENIASLNRDTQKRFLNFCIDMFRQALLFNYETKKLVYFEPTVNRFTLDKFAPFVSGNNINEIFIQISDAIYHIDRNGNAKIILTDLSIKLTRLFYKS
jgi:DNA polymerase-3 subunit delta'